MDARNLFESLIENCDDQFICFSDILESTEPFEVLNKLPELINYLESEQFYPGGFVLEQEKRGALFRAVSDIRKYATLKNRLLRIADDIINGDVLFELRVDFFKDVSKNGQEPRYQHLCLTYKDNTREQGRMNAQNLTALLYLTGLGTVARAETRLVKT